MAATDSLPTSWEAMRIFSGVMAVGRPSFWPRARAASRPSWVPSMMSSRMIMWTGAGAQVRGASSPASPLRPGLPCAHLLRPGAVAVCEVDEGVGDLGRVYDDVQVGAGKLEHGPSSRRRLGRV